MIHVITTNPISIKSIKDYHQNFVICHMYQKPMLPLANAKLGYVFDIYHEDGMDMSEFEEYLNEPNFEYNFIPTQGITTALDSIAQTVVEREVDIELNAEDTDDEIPELITLAIVTQNIRTNVQVCSHLNRSLKEQESEIKCLNLYQYLKMTKIEQIETLVKMYLQTDFVYPEDPVAFGYCLSNVLNGVVM